MRGDHGGVGAGAQPTDNGCLLMLKNILCSPLKRIHTAQPFRCVKCQGPDWQQAGMKPCTSCDQRSTGGGPCRSQQYYRQHQVAMARIYTQVCGVPEKAALKGLVWL